MLEMINKWTGTINIDGQEFSKATDFKPVADTIHIVLKPKEVAVKEVAQTTEATAVESTMLRIKVKKYMTQKSTPSFDFMKKWNDDNPMPLRIMFGEKVKETRGMVYMKLHGDIVGERTMICMKCGKPITNSVSQYFGMGPKCGGHNYVNPFDTDEQLKEAVESYKKQIQNITWEGWVIKSAIEEQEEVVQ